MISPPHSRTAAGPCKAAPLTAVPLVEAQSVTFTAPSSATNMQCRFDIDGSAMATSTPVACARPTTTGPAPPVSLTSG